MGDEFCKEVEAGPRIYSFKVKRSNTKTMYLTITESRNNKSKFEGHSSIMIFEENITPFYDAFQESVRYLRKQKNKGPSYSEELRSEYPNAYKKWDKKDDDLLKEEFDRGKSVKELAEIFLRNEGAINARLGKLGLIGFY